MKTMTRYVKKRLATPDEIREFPNGSGMMRVLELGDEVLGHATFQPGWKWSKDMKPKVGGDSCQVTHNMFVLAGSMSVRMDDGEEFELQPGDAASIGAGHDAWVLGPEACVCVDWTGARTYAK